MHLQVVAVKFLFALWIFGGLLWLKKHRVTTPTSTVRAAFASRCGKAFFALRCDKSLCEILLWMDILRCDESFCDFEARNDRVPVGRDSHLMSPFAIYHQY